MEQTRKQSLIKVGIFLAIVILVNFISVRIFGRIDLTDNNLYSLSDASIDIVENVDDIVSIQAFFTEDLPSPYNNNRRVLLDLLNEYKAYAGSNLQYEFINPVDKESEAEARKNQIPPLKVQVVEEDKMEVKKAYMGLVIRYEDKKETIPVVQNLGSLEYDISSAIKRLTRDEKKKIGYTQEHGELDLKEMNQISEQLKKNYKLTPVNLKERESIPQDIAALLIINPTEKFEEKEKVLLDQYVMKGGKIALMAGKVKIDPNLKSRKGEPLDLGLDDLLGSWGIRVNQDMVYDKKCANISVVQNKGGFSVSSRVPFPLLVKATNFAEDNVIVKDLETLVLQFTSSIDTSLASQKGIDAEVIVSSSEQSGRETSDFTINPFKKYSQSDMGEGNISLAAIFSGSFKSRYYGENPKAELEESSDTRIVVVGTGMFIQGQFVMSPDNRVFFANVIDYLAEDSGLISIRSKNVSRPELEEVSDGTRNFIKYGNMFVPPLLVIFIGLLKWRRKIAIKKSIEERL